MAIGDSAVARRRRIGDNGRQMKRLAWILLAVFCTALAQVQPVEPVVQPKRSCCGRCEACHMPGCALPVAHVPSAMVTERPGTVARPKTAQPTPQLSTFVERFYVFVDAPVDPRAPLPPPVRVAPAASVPLFKAHCSFRI